ncbi:hypothetical protein EW145_g1403 [Phellinidium pouzarii]|uniref:Protein kinase domain-containing protein n=2 Tax=Phellinidium pouzarii TaxID=167371 RepID=A0A4S4LEL5_9AGAM|nr:hypothetical protein EW145_g1403 [Phellinidium pouzarii]
MSGKIITLFCYIYRRNDEPSHKRVFQVEIDNTKSVDKLKEVIKAKKPSVFGHVEADNLRLWNVEIPSKNNAVFKERLAAYIKNDHKLDEDMTPSDELCDVFPDRLPKNSVHIIIREPSNADEEAEEKEEEMKDMFKHIIITVNKRGFFQAEDESLNKIAMWTGALPDFVKHVDDRLKVTRNLPVRDQIALLKEFDLNPNYDFGLGYHLTPLAQEERHGEELSELSHVMASTGRHGGIEKWEKSLETAACSRFFFPLADYIAKSLETGQSVEGLFGTQSWPWNMLIRVKDEGEDAYTYLPKSDFSLWKRQFPILLCEIHSKGSNDRIRLLLQAAYCVRLANFQLQAENEDPKANQFVLVAIYVDEEFKAHLHLFFEAEKVKELPRRSNRKGMKSRTNAMASTSVNGLLAPPIFYTEEVFRLYHAPDQADERLLFISRLYNIFEWLGSLTLPKEQPKNYIGAIKVLGKGTFLKTNTSRGRTNSTREGNKGKDKDKDKGKGGNADAGNGKVRGREAGMSAFQADKYQLVSTGEPLHQQQENIYRVQRIGDKSKTTYIAKRLHADLKELKIFQALEAVERRCENIIRLVDTIESSVGKCIVLPRLKCIGDELFRGSVGGALRGHYIDLSRDLARGITFLHDRNIAHLDIKPDNLVYTSEYRLQIIDFDTSVWVESEDEKIEGYIGSEGWMAPEIGLRGGENFSYSPIRADRYSCGRVFMHFATVHEYYDEGLFLFAVRLTMDNPYKRPQLREWCEPASRSEDGENSDSETLVTEAEESESKVQMNEESVKRSWKRPCNDIGMLSAANLVY